MTFATNGVYLRVRIASVAAISVRSLSPLAAELGFTRVRPLLNVAEVGYIRLRLRGLG